MEIMNEGILNLTQKEILWGEMKLLAAMQLKTAGLCDTTDGSVLCGGGEGQLWDEIKKKNSSKFNERIKILGIDGNYL